MSAEDNKAVVVRWFTDFWGDDFDAGVIDELAAPDIRFEYSLHKPLRGRDDGPRVRAAVPRGLPRSRLRRDRRPHRRGRLRRRPVEGGRDPHRPRVRRPPVGSLPAGSGRTMEFTGTTIIKVVDGMIAEEVGLDDGVAVLQQLGLIPQG